MAKNSRKTFYFGSSRSFKVIDVTIPESSARVLVIVSSMSVSICKRFHAIRANIGKVRTFVGGTPV